MRPASLFLLATWFLFAAALSASAQGSCSWTDVGGGVGGASNERINALTVFDDGTGPALYAGGNFTTAGGMPAGHIAKWDGASWSPLAGGLGGGGNSVSVLALTVFDDGSGPALYAGGQFSMAGGMPASHIARWDGVAWSPLGSGTNALVSSMTVFHDGTSPALVVGGVFSAAGAVQAASVAKWNGTAWSALGGGSASSIGPLAVFDDGTGSHLFAGAQSPVPCGTLSYPPCIGEIRRWNGSSWSVVGSTSSTSVPKSFLDLQVFDEGAGPSLFVGGAFSTLSGATTGTTARWDGTTWSALGSGVSGGSLGSVVWALTVFDDGTGASLYAGGSFSTAGGVPANGIARWDGMSWSPLGLGVSGSPMVFLPESIRSLTVFDDGAGPALYAGGVFTMAGGQSATNIAKWSCGSTISIGATQGSPGSAVYLNNANLTFGNEYYNIFSLDLCPAGAGAGPYLGLCITTPVNAFFVIDQLQAPMGTPMFHFVASSDYVSWGPYPILPIAVDAICFDFTGGVLGPVSPVTRITIQ